jgi:hypothetical protein
MRSFMTFCLFVLSLGACDATTPPTPAEDYAARVQGSLLPWCPPQDPGPHGLVECQTDDDCCNLPACIQGGESLEKVVCLPIHGSDVGAPNVVKVCSVVPERCDNGCDPGPYPGIPGFAYCRP